MKITNFNPGTLKTTKNLYFFDNCLVEYFEGDVFNIYGNIETSFIEGEIDITYVTLNIVKDSNKKTISLSDAIRKEIEKEIEDLFEGLPIEDEFIAFDNSSYNYKNLDYLNGK